MLNNGINPSLLLYILGGLVLAIAVYVYLKKDRSELIEEPAEKSSEEKPTDKRTEEPTPAPKNDLSDVKAAVAIEEPQPAAESPVSVEFTETTSSVDEVPSKPQEVVVPESEPEPSSSIDVPSDIRAEAESDAQTLNEPVVEPEIKDVVAVETERQADVLEPKAAAETSLVEPEQKDILAPEVSLEVHDLAEAEPEVEVTETEAKTLESSDVDAQDVPDTKAADVVQEEPVAAPTPLVAKSEPEEAPEQRKKRLFDRIRSGLSRTKENLTSQISELFGSSKEIDDDLLEELETLLLTADVGMDATTALMARLTEKVARKQLKDPQALKDALKAELIELLSHVEQGLVLPAADKPQVILVVGVNGVGKTTTIGKLAKRFQAEGKSVMLAAGDTFRAAAVEQLQVWGERNAVPVVAQHTGADSASVIFDALQSATAKGIDVLIADTAGRLQNKENLMNELAKVVRVMKKIDPEAPHEVMLVLDAGTGQNAISQAKQFQEAVGVTGITLTKLDGTAKGGIIFAVAKQFGLPIRFIGVGEQIDDLRPFAADEFVAALFD
ncbi:signal recognition particle-docking protein FtsY [Nitrincola tibetensis]|uniref:Signal recognition particle receptor FtsY n=2 Tax=Nitrincola tibetensis TaxID=2219697 RepID=A0A364NHM6_9GAMM|nr:signal recognition particle-docking protein FtsY [Nitrincola tibetensis]